MQIKFKTSKESIPLGAGAAPPPDAPPRDAPASGSSSLGRLGDGTSSPVTSVFSSSFSSADSDFGKAICNMNMHVF